MQKIPDSKPQIIEVIPENLKKLNSDLKSNLKKVLSILEDVRLYSITMVLE
jgi:hypothetical protein